MKAKIYLSITSLFIFTSVFSYTSPGTNQKITLDNLVTLSGGEVTFSSNAYHVNANITISTTDTLSITSDATVKFGLGFSITVNGVMIVNPPLAVLFTAENIATGYNGIALSFSDASFFKKLTFEYGVSFKLSDSKPRIDSCVFQFNNNNTSTTFGNGAISLFRSSPIITNSKFLNNQRAAIQGGSNISNAPKIINCIFQGNNTNNANLPQINLGSTATGPGIDTVRIIGCQILEASTNSGGIGFLPTGNVYAVIHGNVIRKNRYGITFNGGSNINAVVSYNIIDSNRTQNDPLLGGSGIAFSGGSSTSHQKVVVTGNVIRWNLWGITVGPTTTGGGAMPNLGNLTNTDTSDNGKNTFINNNNSGSTPQIDLYNNNVDDIFAQGNYWGTDDPNTVEARVFHKPDNSALGTVTYSSFLVPVELLSFSGAYADKRVNLSWKTAIEVNSSSFEIERSFDGINFTKLGSVVASGNSISDRLYSFTHVGFGVYINHLYYRLKLIDKDGKYKYSHIILVRFDDAQIQDVNVFPTLAKQGENLTAEFISNGAKDLEIIFYDSNGKELGMVKKQLGLGLNNISIQPVMALSKGYVFIKFITSDFTKTLPVIIR